MGRIYDTVDDDLAAWLHAQPVFFVGTAPGGTGGHVNVSPKGMADTFRILGPRSVAYLDFIGSGIETVAHLRDNGRIVIMFCAFSGAPRIVRLHGRGQAILPGDADWEELAARFPPRHGARSIVTVELDRVSDSCGFGVPLMTYDAERTQLVEWADRKTEDELAEYRMKKNSSSIDGLPGLAE